MRSGESRSIFPQVAFDIICFTATLLLFSKTFLEKTFRRLCVTNLTHKIVGTLLGLQQSLLTHRDVLISSLEDESKKRDGCDDGISCAVFIEAVRGVLQDRGVQTSPAALESLFFTLKLIHGDEDEHALDLSAGTREFLVTSRGIPVALVSPLSAVRFSRVALPGPSMIELLIRMLQRRSKSSWVLTTALRAPSLLGSNNRPGLLS